MTAEEFFVWSESVPDGERYELVDGHPLRLQAETNRHALAKQNVFDSLRAAVREAQIANCRALPDGVSVRISENQVREPDALINCGEINGDDLYAQSPVIVVEVLSPSIHRVDMARKLIDYFQVASIQHYLIVFAVDRRVIHHSRFGLDDKIVTQIAGPDSRLRLDPPGIDVDVADFFVDLPDGD